MHQELNPIDFHCHGFATLDLASPFSEEALGIAEAGLRADASRAILAFFVSERRFSELLDCCTSFDSMRRSGRLQHVVGIGLEGPLTSSAGGTPRECQWAPTRLQWSRIASQGEKGLRYVVLSPDAEVNPSHSSDHPPSIEWVYNALLSNGVMPAIGHFSKADPARSAASIQALLSWLEARHAGPIVTDHLFNDMPLTFKHAWRTQSEREARKREVEHLQLSTWNHANWREVMGPVPAEILEGARRGLINVCLNCDGAHVDIEICKRIVELVGSDRVMLMTDRIADVSMAGHPVFKYDSSTLLYGETGIVAGSRASVWDHVKNLADVQLPPDDILNVAQGTAAELLRLP
jgi:N-acetylglucosamine-6-phosphate deacetylase